MFYAAPPPGRVRLLLAPDGAPAFRAVFLPVAAGCKGLSAPFAGPCTLPVNIGAEYLVGGQNRPSEVLAQQRIGNHLRAHAALAVVQRQAGRKLAYKLIDYGYIHAVKIGTTPKIPKISVINYVMEKEVKKVG